MQKKKYLNRLFESYQFFLNCLSMFNCHVCFGCDKLFLNNNNVYNNVPIFLCSSYGQIKPKFYLLFGRRGGRRRRGSGWDAIYVLVLVSTFGPTYCKQNCLYVLLFNYCDISVSNMLLWESKVKTETVPRRGGSSETEHLWNKEKQYFWCCRRHMEDLQNYRRGQFSTQNWIHSTGKVCKWRTAKGFRTESHLELDLPNPRLLPGSLGKSFTSDLSQHDQETSIIFKFFNYF